MTGYHRKAELAGGRHGGLGLSNHDARGDRVRRRALYPRDLAVDAPGQGCCQSGVIGAARYSTTLFRVQSRESEIRGYISAKNVRLKALKSKLFSDSGKERFLRAAVRSYIDSQTERHRTPTVRTGFRFFGLVSPATHRRNENAKRDRTSIGQLASLGDIVQVRGAGLGISSMPCRRITLRNRSTVSFLRRPGAKAWHPTLLRSPVLQTSFRRFSTAPRRSISVCPVMTCEKSVAPIVCRSTAILLLNADWPNWTSATLRSDCECR